jgi:hypothetical protein
MLNALGEAADAVDSPEFYQKLMDGLQTFAPGASVRALMIDGEMLLDLGSGERIHPDVHHHFIITERRPVASRVGNRVSVLFLIALQKQFIFEYSSDLTLLHELDGVVDLVQRRRILPVLSFDEDPSDDRPYRSLRISHDQIVADNPNIPVPFVYWKVATKRESKTETTYLYDLSEECLTQGKKLIIIDADSSKNDEMFVFPFTPFHVLLFKAFSNFSASQCLLRLQNGAFTAYKIRARPASCFANCFTQKCGVVQTLSILVNILTEALGPETTIQLYMPPILSEYENGQTRFVVKEKQNTFVIINVPSGITPPKFVILNAFSDFYMSFIKDFIRITPLIAEGPGVLPRALDLDVTQRTPAQLVAIATALFTAFGIDAFLGLEDTAIRAWVGYRAAHAGHFFNRMVISLYFAHYLLTALKWFDQLSTGVRTALAFSIFLEFSPFSPKPMSKYQDIIALHINSSAGIGAISKIAAFIGQIGDDNCDLLASATPSAISALIHELLVPYPMGRPIRSLSLFHAFRRNLPLQNMERGIVVRRFVMDAAILSCFFVPRAAFSSCIGEKPNLHKLRFQDSPLTVLFGTELAAFSPSFSFLPAVITGNITKLDNLLNG